MVLKTQITSALVLQLSAKQDTTAYQSHLAAIYTRAPYSVRMWENMDQNNSECGHFSCSGQDEINFCPVFTCRIFQVGRNK